MHILNTRWAMIAGLVIGGTATLIGCGSSNTASGTGGATGTGGRVGTGGGTGTGGSGTGGATVTHKLSYTFDTGPTPSGWALSTFAEPAPRNNLGGIYPSDGGTDAATDGGTAAGGPTLEFDSTAGSPAPGSLKLTATFTAYGQYVDPVVNIAGGQDLTGSTLHGRVQLISGTFTGGAQLHVSTGATFDAYGKADFPPFGAPGTWLNAAIDLTTAAASNPPAVLNPAAVMQVGVQFFSSNLMPAGTLLPAPETVVFNIDTIQD